MAVAINSQMASNVGVGVSGNPVTSPQTASFTNTAGTVMYLWVGLITTGSTLTLGAITYGGVALTQILTPQLPGAADARGLISLYRLLSPATGANTISVAGSTGGTLRKIMFGAITLTGNHATTPEAQAAISTSGTSTSPSSGALSGVVSGNITLGMAACGTNMTAQTQTLDFNNATDNAFSMGNMRASTSAASGSVTHGFTAAGSDSWAAAAVEVAASAGAAAVIPNLTQPPMR